MCTREEYLRQDRGCNVIEIPVDEELDTNGWDLDKALKLLHSSNPAMFEWLASPVVYRDCPFRQRMLQGEKVKAKKYFYVLRPSVGLLLDTGSRSSAALLFDDLCREYLGQEVRSEVEMLLERKRTLPEMGMIERIAPLDAYIEGEIRRMEVALVVMSRQQQKDWKRFNQIFLEETARF